MVLSSTLPCFPCSLEALEKDELLGEDWSYLANIMAVLVLRATGPVVRLMPSLMGNVADAHAVFAVEHEGDVRVMSASNASAMRNEHGGNTRRSPGMRVEPRCE